MATYPDFSVKMDQLCPPDLGNTWNMVTKELLRWVENTLHLMKSAMKNEAPPPPPSPAEDKIEDEKEKLAMWHKDLLAALQVEDEKQIPA